MFTISIICKRLQKLMTKLSFAAVLLNYTNLYSIQLSVWICFSLSVVKYPETQRVIPTPRQKRNLVLEKHSPRIYLINNMNNENDSTVLYHKKKLIYVVSSLNIICCYPKNIMRCTCFHEMYLNFLINNKPLC